LANVSETVADPDLRVLIALHALALTDTREAEEALHLAVQAFRGPKFYTPGQNYEVRGIALSGDGKLLATANNDDSVTFSNAHDGIRRGDPLKIDAGVEGITFSPNGALAVATARGSVRMIDTSGALLQPEIDVSKQEVKSIAISADGSKLATGNQDSSVATWNLPSGPLRLQAGHTAPVRALAFSPKPSSYLVSAGVDGTVIGWDAGSGMQAFRMVNPDGSPFTALALSPSGRIAVTGDSAGSVRIWEIPSGRLVDRQQHSPSKGVAGVAFSSDGRVLGSIGVDGKLKLWDVDQAGSFRERIHIPCGTRDEVRCTAMAFLTDGRTLAVAGQNGEVRLYQTDVNKLLQEASSLVDPRLISVEDCRKYLQKPACEVPTAFRLDR
jgi:WD40 repeat protein